MIEDPIKQGAKYLWLMLQTHHVMKDYVTAKFWEHLSIAPMLNISLHKMVVTTDKFDTIRELCKKMELTVTNAKVMVERAPLRQTLPKDGASVSLNLDTRRQLAQLL